MSQKLIIDWVRHAESCSNLLTNNITDKNPNYKNPNSPPPTTSPLTSNPIYKYLKKYYKLLIKPDYYNHPSLSFIGVQQAIQLGLDYVQLIQPYDAVFVSPTFRSVMTAILAFRHNPNQVIYVVPYILEFANIQFLNISENILQDKTNIGIPAKKLQKAVSHFKKWLEEYWIDNCADLEINIILQTVQIVTNNRLAHNIINNFSKSKTNKKQILNSLIVVLQNDNKYLYQNYIDKLNKIMNITSSTLPKINYDYICGKYSQDLQSRDFDKFYTNILSKNSNFNKILCVSHGRAMAEYFEKKYNKHISMTFNTQVFREVIYGNSNSSSSKNNKNNINYNQYIPISIRTDYKDIVPEDNNCDLCKNNSLDQQLNNIIKN